MTTNNHFKLLFASIFCVGFLLYSDGAFARDVWVDNSCATNGNGNTEFCTDGATGPYNDLHVALAEVLPGDRVLIKNGTGAYVTTNPGPYNPSVDGGFHINIPYDASADPVIITSAPGHYPLLANCAVNDFTTYCPNPTFTARTGKIVFDGLTIQGGIVIRGHVAVINSRLSKGWEPAGDGNLGAIKIIHGANWNIGPIRNNYFHDLVTPIGTSPFTRAWIYVFYSENLLIEYNTFEGYNMTGGQGAYIDKHSHSVNMTFRYNLVIDGKGGPSGSDADIHSYGNVIHCGQQTNGDGMEITSGQQYHNTIVNCRSGYYVHPEDGRYPERLGTRDGQLYNNIFNNLYEAAQRIYEPSSALSPSDYFTGLEHIDYNAYTPNRYFYWVHNWYGQSWNEWRNGIAANFSFDQNSAELTCEFIDAANHDYRLVQGSACTTFGRVGGVPSGGPVELGAFAVTNCVGHLCSPGSGYIPYDSTWRTSAIPPTPPQLVPALLFESNWSTATGNSEAAIGDGGRWGELFWCGRNDIIAVTAASALNWSKTPNVLQVNMLGNNGCRAFQVRDVVAQSTSHYGRFYFRNDEQYQDWSHHNWAYNFVGSIQAVYFNRRATPEGWMLDLRLGAPYPYNIWSLQTGLASNAMNPPFVLFNHRRWYRYEWYVEYTGANTYRLYPRIYDDQDVLLYDMDSFYQIDNPNSGSLTLAQWYGQGNSFEMNDPSLARHVGIGNEGRWPSPNYNESWYIASFALCDDTWCGPAVDQGLPITVPPLAGPADSTPPIATITSPSSGLTLAQGATSIPLTVTTNEPALCRWSLQDSPYWRLGLDSSVFVDWGLFPVTGGTEHTALVVGMTPDPAWSRQYTIHVRCEDFARNPMSTSATVTITAPAGTALADTTPPTALVVNPAPGAVLPYGTRSVNAVVQASEFTACRWSNNDQAFTSMSMDNNLTRSGVNTISGAMNHTTVITGLEDGESYTRYVRCMDHARNQQTTSTVITFSVSGEPEQPPPTANRVGDLNGDGVVNLQDVILIVENFRRRGNYDVGADINGDGIVNILDMVLLAREWAADISGSGNTNEPVGFSMLTLQEFDDVMALPHETVSSGTWVAIGKEGYNGSTGMLRQASGENAPLGGTGVVEGLYFEGGPNGYAPGRAFYSAPSGELPNEFYWSMEAKVDGDFINHPFQLKWHFVSLDSSDWFWIDWRHRFEGNTGSPSGYEESNLRLRFQGSGWQPTGAWSNTELVEQNVQPSIVPFPRGEWVHLELYARYQNTTQAPHNGIVRLWQDGVLILELTDHYFPGTGARFWYHEGTYGGADWPVPKNQSWYVSQSYISVPGD